MYPWIKSSVCPIQIINLVLFVLLLYFVDAFLIKWLWYEILFLL
ncbi:hypothetical protein ECH_1150 [Ehrlichia chaffeensis str. Arkansas]|uniref:Uncharacterized protein n=1 Tax=Ehrlichia chaffeensis (strain ATCC CRL-10679 / Arkansas) TaxID=205920 RepID=Q2GF49_EHRCR|nr:hypothetical protein ECH_1150 [Ehrlichia chaffeensis str. Arkansas]